MAAPSQNGRHYALRQQAKENNHQGLAKGCAIYAQLGRVSPERTVRANEHSPEELFATLANL